MPQMGVSVSEGTVTKWLKQQGEADRAGRAAARDLDRQGRHRGAEPGRGCRGPDPGAGRDDRRGRHGAGSHRTGRRGAAANGPPPPTRAAGRRRARGRSRAGRRRTARAGARAGAATGRLGEPAAAGAGRAATAGRRPGRRPHVRVPGRGTHRRRARGRSECRPGHRAGRSRDEEGHPRLHRVRCRRARSGGGRGGAACRRRAAAGCRSASAHAARACHRAATGGSAAPAPPPPAAPVAATPAREPRLVPPAADDDELAPGEAAEPVTAMRRGVMEHMRRSLDTAAHVTSADRGGHVPRGRDPRAAEAESAGDRRCQPDLPGLRRPRDRGDAQGLPVGQRPVPRREDHHQAVRQPRHRRVARRGPRPDRARDPQRPGPEPARHRPCDRRSRRARTDEEAAPRRRAGRHLHDHQPGRLRHLPRDADHQPAAGGDPRHLRARQAPVGRAGRARPGRDRDPAGDEPHADLRPPTRRRCVRRSVPPRPARAPGDAGGERARNSGPAFAPDDAGTLSPCRRVPT